MGVWPWRNDRASSGLLSGGRHGQQATLPIMLQDFLPSGARLAINYRRIDHILSLYSNYLRRSVSLEGGKTWHVTQ